MESITQITKLHKILGIWSYKLYYNFDSGPVISFKANMKLNLETYHVRTIECTVTVCQLMKTSV